VFLRIRTAFGFIKFENINDLVTYLEIDNNQDYNNSSKEVRKVGCILSVESILEGIELVALRQEEMEEGDYGSFEFCALLGSDGNGGEALPHYVLTDVCGYKQRYTTAKTITLLQKLIK
jgi:hypothetical protein